jgi:Na+-driven multidrug efflux pump
MATVRLWIIRLPMILFMHRFTNLGASGIWYAMVISNLLILAVGEWFYRKVDFAPYADLTAEKGT